MGKNGSQFSHPVAANPLLLFKNVSQHAFLGFPCFVDLENTGRAGQGKARQGSSKVSCREQPWGEFPLPWSFAFRQCLGHVPCLPTPIYTALLAFLQIKPLMQNLQREVGELVAQLTMFLHSFFGAKCLYISRRPVVNSCYGGELFLLVWVWWG